jgi:predicted metal-dependent hydrolase
MVHKKKTSAEVLYAEGLQVELIRSSKRRTLTLEVRPCGVRARAPWRMPESDIREFIRNKSVWIQKTQESLPPPLPELELAQGAPILLNGKTYSLVVVNQRGLVQVENEKILVPISRTHLSEHETIKRKLVAWLKAEAQRSLDELVSVNLAHMLPDCANPKIRIRDYRRRWGSCDHRGSLSFNWRIIMAPVEIQNYIVVHEIAHLSEFNHSSRFWSIVARQDPQWKMHQNWLTKNGQRLYRF